MQYRKEIDGIRALAVVPVVTYHLFGDHYLPGGYVGVDVFFVISGYLITSNLILDKSKLRFSIVRFYERRARRILPALITVLTFVLGVGFLVSLPEPYKDIGEAAFASTVFASNILFYMTTGYFQPDAGEQALLHLWTLSVEEQFYLALPFVILWTPSARTRLAVFLLLILLSLGTTLIAARSFSFYMITGRLFELLIGSTVASMEQSNGRLFNRMRHTAGLFWVGLALLMWSFATFNSESQHPGLITLVPVLATAAVLIGSRDSRAGAKVLSAAPLVWVGILSYSLYLWHVPLLAFATQIKLNPLTLSEKIGLVAATFVFAIASYRFIERPFRNAAKVSTKWFFGIAVTGMALCGCIGLTLYHARGVRDRFSDDVLALHDSRYDRDALDQDCSNGPSNQNCHLGAEGVGPDVALLGDSHAWSVANSLGAHLRPLRRSAIGLYRSGCPAAYFGVDAACLEHNRKSEAYVLGNPGLKSVILLSAWDLPLPAHSSRLAELIRTLSNHGRRVILVHRIPPQPRSVPEYLARLRTAGRDIEGAGTSLSAFQSQFSATEFGLADATVGVRSIASVYPEKIFCDAETNLCRMAQGGASLYYDSAHLSVAGAELLVREIMMALRRR